MKKTQQPKKRRCEVCGSRILKVSQVTKICSYCETREFITRRRSEVTKDGR